MIPALMSMFGSMGGSAMGGLGGLGGQMGSSMMGGQAGSQMPRGGYLDDRMMSGQPIGGDIGNNMGFDAPQSQQADKDFMGVMQQGMGSGTPQMAQMAPLQDEQPIQQPYSSPYGLMGYSPPTQSPYNPYGLMGY